MPPKSRAYLELLTAAIAEFGENSGKKKKPKTDYDEKKEAQAGSRTAGKVVVAKTRGTCGPGGGGGGKDVALGWRPTRCGGQEIKRLRPTFAE